MQIQCFDEKLECIPNHQDNWHQVDEAVTRGSGAGYDEAVRLLIEPREAASQFPGDQEFRERFSAWVPSHLRCPAFVKRLHDRKFPLPEM